MHKFMRSFTSVAAALAALTLVGCTVHQTETPALSGPSDVALSMSVSSNPQTITQNGSDAAVVSAKVYFTDPRTGTTSPKANLPIRFDMVVNGVTMDYGTLSARSAVTGSDGIARTTYTAPPMPAGGNTGNGCNGMPGQCISIIATTTDSTAASSGGATANGSATIALVPQGVILPPAGAPTASFTVTPTPVSQGTPVTFDASASSPGTGASSIASYSWTFGDGFSGSGKTVSHTYNSAATFSVTLTVTNDRGLSASTTQTVGAAAPQAPVPIFVFSPQPSPIVGQTVFFNADQSTSAPGHNIVQFNWNYGDGSPEDSGITVSHVFAAPGTYNVSLSVVDDVGQRAAKSVGVPIGSGNPSVVITFSPTSGTHPITIAFSSAGTTAAGGATIVSWAWDFGDPTSGSSNTSNLQNPTHLFSNAGTYSVRLVVTDNIGRVGTSPPSSVAIQ
jgi:PKD repeat protein